MDLRKESGEKLRVKRHSVQSGFTLIEIIIAVMILAISFTTILGLQSSSTDQAIRTRNKQQAMLMAREIMSAIELTGTAIENTSMNAPARVVLEKYLPADSKKPIEKDPTALPLTADLNINYWGVKGLPDKSIKRVTLKLYWSDNPQDKIVIEYFIPIF